MVEATIRDVASRAQVSVALVSRALNGLDDVSEGTRWLVFEAANALRYVPHAGGRSRRLTVPNAEEAPIP